MIKRYTRSEMENVWTLESRFARLLEVEVAVAQVQGDMGIIPKKAADDIRKKSKFRVERILEIEKTTKHDIIAFVSTVAESVGKNGRYLHFGMTSSDAIDTALSLQVANGFCVLEDSLSKLEKALKKSAMKYIKTICAGRTHGMHAEPTSFGMKMASHFVELKRHRSRIQKAADQMRVCKLSGAVGTYSALSMQVEKKVANLLKLKPELIATQVVPRDRHAELMLALAQYGCGIERLAVELRHLQRTEVGEVYEGFSKGQKGSSAMPHKKNPISSENLTGAARMLRSYASASLENIALWHERDISHSSVERVFMPDAFMLLDYAADRMAGVVENLVVDKQRMKSNMNLSQGQLFSSHVLLEIVKSGVSREDAYKLVQKCSHSLKAGEHLKEKLLSDKKASKYLSKKALDSIFSGERHLVGIEKLVTRALKEK